MILKLEGHCDRSDATIDDVVRAVAEIARPDGPTYIVVEDGLDPRTSQRLSAGSTVSGGRTTGPCLDPAVHIADLVTAALGYPGNPADVG